MTAPEVPRLAGPPDHLLEFEPLRYQYPALPGRSQPGSADWDANWVVVRILASDGERRWGNADPAFTTWELNELVQWFRYIASGELKAPAAFEATEPCLQFEVRSAPGVPQVRAVFDLEFRPATG